MVGSSSSSRSGCANSTEASATRMRQPPEKDEAGRSCAAASKPRPARIVAARASAEWASMSASRMWISAIRCGSVAVCFLGEQRRRVPVSALSTISISGSSVPGASCATWPMRVVFGKADRAGLGRKLAADGAKQRGLAGAVASDQARFGAGRQRQRGMVEQKPPGNAQRKVVDDQHGAGRCGRPGRGWQVLLDSGTARRSGLPGSAARPAAVRRAKPRRAPPDRCRSRRNWRARRRSAS